MFFDDIAASKRYFQSLKEDQNRTNKENHRQRQRKLQRKKTVLTVLTWLNTAATISLLPKIDAATIQ